MKKILVSLLLLVMVMLHCNASASQSLDYEINIKKTVHAHLVGEITNEEADIFDSELEQLSHLLPDESSVHINRHDGNLTSIMALDMNNKLLGYGVSLMDRSAKTTAKSGTDQIAEAMAGLKKSLKQNAKTPD